MVCRWMILVLGLTISPTALGQERVDPFDFLEEWAVLRQKFQRGSLDVTPEGMPIGFETSLSKLSEKGLFQVDLEAEMKPAPFNEIHSWLITITTPDGAAVTDAKISFYGGMPLHNHGYPTEPRLAGEIAAGVYRLEGIKFSMAGWWTMAMGIAAGDETDRVGFNIVFEH